MSRCSSFAGHLQSVVFMLYGQGSNMCADGIPHGRQLLQSPRPWRALLLQGGRQGHQGANSLHHWGNEAHEWNRGDSNCHTPRSCSCYSMVSHQSFQWGVFAAIFAHAVCVAYSVQSVRVLLLSSQLLLCWPYRLMWVELLSSGLLRMGLRLLLDRWVWSAVHTAVKMCLSMVLAFMAYFTQCSRYCCHAWDGCPVSLEDGAEVIMLTVNHMYTGAVGHQAISQLTFIYVMRSVWN
jgi:hypothetical protein